LKEVAGTGRAEGPATRIVPAELFPLFANTLALLRSDYTSIGKGLESYSPALAYACILLMSDHWQQDAPGLLFIHQLKLSETLRSMERIRHRSLPSNRLLMLRGALAAK
jgi:hypothetical protein